ncbi:hypothetical protein E2C01_085791 [Portunus trituberculatus]|uniref:Uncharacterized protein n=1 Tax=Portunus trituberculatus TaxID=210409 RepID=A0A5B7IZ25_PORTR|nr:hypothetical protein [Portunus trituberculatus]
MRWRRHSKIEGTPAPWPRSSPESRGPRSAGSKHWSETQAAYQDVQGLTLVADVKPPPIHID